MKKVLLFSLIAIQCIYSEVSTPTASELLKQKLFEKAFKKKLKTSKIYIPLQVNKILQDEVLVKIDNKSHVKITKKTLDYIASLLKDEYKNQLDYSAFKRDKFVSLSVLNQLGIESKFDNKYIVLDILLPPHLKKASLIKLTHRRHRENDSAIIPEDYSGGINLYVNQQYQDNNGNGFRNNLLNASSDITFNAHGFVLEGRLQYLDSGIKEGSQFSRGNFRVVKDDIENSIRYTAGDIILPHHQRMSYAQALGVGVERFININSDYAQNLTRISSHEFFLKNRSRVEVFVNGRYSRSLNLLPGTHNLYDLSLPNGLNRIQLKVIEDGGKIEYVDFNDFSYAEVLRQGVLLYGAGAGVTSELFNDKITYYKDEAVASGYMKYGLLSDLTVEAGLQSGKDYLAEELELIIGTNFGLFNPYIIASQYGELKGLKQGFDYRTNIVDATLSLGYENTDENYRTMGRQPIAQKSRLIRANIYSNIGWGINMGLTATEYLHDEEEESTYGLVLRKSFGQWLTEVNVEHTVLNNRERQSEIYCLVDYRFGENNARYANYINENKQQLNLRHDSSARYGLSSELQSEIIPSGHSYNLRSNLENEKFRLDTNYNVVDRKNSVKNESLNIQLATGVAFAGNNFVVTSPLTSSFVIVKNDEKLEEPLGVVTYQESDDFIYDDYSLEIGDYSQRKLFVNSDNLDFGIDLRASEQEFISYYKTGAVMEIAVQSLYSVKGEFLDTKTRKPISRQSFTVINRDTGEKSIAFTNSNGKFTLSDIAPGFHNIRFRKSKGYKDVARYQFMIKESDELNSMTDLGKIYLEMPEKEKIEKHLIHRKSK